MALAVNRGGGRMMGGWQPLPEGANQRVNPRTFARVVRFFRPYWRRIAVTIVAILIVAVLGLVNPFLLRLVIDESIPNRDLDQLYRLVALMIAVPIVSGLITIGSSYLNISTGQRVMQDLRNALYGHLQQLQLRFFTATRTGEIQARLSSDVAGVQTVVTDTATSVVNNLATALSTIVAMWLINWQLALISLGLLPIFLLLTYRVGTIRREVTTATQRTVADITALVEETLSVSGVLLTKAFGRQQREVERFRVENERLTGFQTRQQLVGRWFFMIIQTFFAITPAVVYWYAGRAIIGDSEALTIGDIVAFTTLQSRLFFPVGQLLNVQVEIQGAFALFDRIFEYLDLPVEISDRAGARTLAPATTAGHLRFRHVSFSYTEPPLDRSLDDPPDETGPGPFGLHDIDFDVLPGQLVALVGPSGSGKTTIGLLTARLYDADAGAIEIDGTDIRDVTLTSLGHIVGMVTQETYLFHATVRENIAYGDPDATDEAIAAAARAAAIHDRIVELSLGYATVVGERGYKLSGGEKQRIAIARVILKNPRILILDEATSALDTTSERLIQAALEPLMANRTTVAIAHRLSTILAADVILVIDRGRIVERGTHPELLAAAGLYARLYNQQFSREPAVVTTDAAALRRSLEVTAEAVDTG
ncbi:MAG: ABC transporter ATP-binding protein/permease [Chloroflexota bacterium]|nr:ABC transporter ATP-binding protein/permease [Chloroflexota bacterium]